MRTVGYAFLQQHLALPIPPVREPAQVQAVGRVGPGAGDTLSVPPAVAPVGDDALDHILFALKHEGTDLLVLTQALQRIPAARMASVAVARPTSRFVRKAGYLWEAVHGRRLAGVAPGGNYVPLFDPARYLTGAERRDARWRVVFNGLGSPRWCPQVRRTPAIEALLAQDLLGQAAAFAQGIGPALLDRALAWAYLGETESSFAIEREVPSADKAAAFAALLREAGRPHPLDEDALVALQNAAITNPYERAVQFRTEQNWLRGPARGAAGVTYVPPPPELAHALMTEWMALANDRSAVLDPLVRAALVSFGFVFIHPFMDGNGRLSRYVAHHVLGQSGRLPQGFVLPLSMAMKRHEADYLRALQSHSAGVRALWRVTWIDEGRYDFEPLSDHTLYRYWDATPCVAFTLRMAQQALQKDLREETQFLLRYDAALKAVEARFDIRANALATLLLGAFQHEGVVSKHRRKQFVGVVPNAAFDHIEAVVRAQLRA